MTKFTVGVSFHFDEQYEFEADSMEAAEKMALRLAKEWKPFSKDKKSLGNGTPLTLKTFMWTLKKTFS